MSLYRSVSEEVELQDESELLRWESKNTLHRLETPGSTEASLQNEDFGGSDGSEFADGSTTESPEEIADWLIAQSKKRYGPIFADICLEPQYAFNFGEDPLSPESGSPSSGQDMMWAQLLPPNLAGERMRLSDVTAAAMCYANQEPVMDRKLADGWCIAEHENLKQMNSVICWPLMACERCIGVIQLLSPDVDTFSVKDSRYKAVLSVAVLRFLRAELQGQVQVQGELLRSVFPAHVCEEILATSRMAQCQFNDINFEPGSVRHGRSFGRMVSGSSDIDSMTSLTPMSRTGTMQSDRCMRQQAISKGLPKLSATALAELDQLLYSDYHRHVAVLFTDIKDFTPLSEQRGPAGVMLMLDKLFVEFDDVIEQFEPMAFKVETVGDAYMVAFGLMPEVRDDEDPSLIAMTALRVAALLQRAAANINDTFQIRIGLHLGDLMSGIMGKRAPLRYSLVGDTVNTASRMESHGVPGKIHVSESFKVACDPCNALGHINFRRCRREIKGKGEMKTFLVDPEEVLRIRNVTSHLWLDPVKERLRGALGL